MEIPDWLMDVRNKFAAQGAWVSTLNILDNEGEEFGCDSDVEIAAHVLLNLAELTDEAQAAAHQTERACVNHLSQTVSARLIDAATTHGDSEGNDAEVADLQRLWATVMGSLSLEQWQALVQQDPVKRLLGA